MATETKTPAKPDVNDAFKKLAEKKETSKGLAASAAKILALLREKGKGADGLTVKQIKSALGDGEANLKKLRDNIRLAQGSGVKAGDLVATFKNGGNTKSYTVVPKEVAATLATETVELLKESATDFAFGDTIKGRFEEDTDN